MPLLDQIEFKGLIRNVELGDPKLTHNELINAFKKAGWTEASFIGEPHFFKRLRERGPTLDIFTLAHFERAMQRGTLVIGKHDRMNLILPSGNAFVSHDPGRGHLFTLCPGDPSESSEA